MEVVRMISFDEAGNRKTSIGGLGGFFQKGMRWADYIDTRDDVEKPYAEAFRRYVVDHKIKEGGDWHQGAPDGAPLFEDGTVGTFSFRAWGDIMAAIWSEEENEDYWYIEFYMSSTMKG